MALLNVTHKPVGAKARQFDGSLEAMLDILNARPKHNISVALRFDAEGNFNGLDVAGGPTGAAISLSVGDWAIFPTDESLPPFSLPNAQATGDWQAA